MSLTKSTHKFAFKDVKGNQKKRKVIISFPAQNFQLPVQVPYMTQMTIIILKRYCSINIQKQYADKFPPSKQIQKFIKDQKKYIPFKRFVDQQDNPYYNDYKQLLKKQPIYIEYIYKNKRDQLCKQVTNFQNQIHQRCKFIQEIKKDYEKSKFMVLRKIASTKQGLEPLNTLNVKVSIILFISDPLIRNQNIPIGHEQLDVQQHIKMLKQASNSSKSLSIHIDKYYAVQYNFSNAFEQSKSTHKDDYKIVHFFTSIVVEKNTLYLSFQDKKQLGQQRLIKLEDFLQKVKNIKQSKLMLLILIGHNVNLLKQYETQSYGFSILLLTTYSPNHQEGFKYFLKSFYQNFFNRVQINIAIQNAKSQYQKKFMEGEKLKQNLFCCCHHNHNQNCIWNKIVQKTGSYLAHKMFYHRALRNRDKAYRLNQKLQNKLISIYPQNQLAIQLSNCASSQAPCCQQSHTRKQLIFDKIIFKSNNLSNENASKMFLYINQSNDFVKNQFDTHIKCQKISNVRRCPQIMQVFVRKIINNRGKIIQFVGNRRIGKSHFIQSSCKYIQNRRPEYIFQNIDLNEGSLQECVKNMYNKARKNKKMVFIHHNNTMEIEKQYLQSFKNRSRGDLPFTFFIKIAGKQQESSNSPIQSNLVNSSRLSLPKLDKLDIICQIYHEFKEEYFQEQKNIDQIVYFAQKYDKKLTFKNIRNFIKYYKQKQSYAWKNKSLISLYDEMSKQFAKKMQSLRQSKPNLFQFVVFMSQFQQGFYLTKLNSIILKVIFNIQDLKGIVKNKQYINYLFQIVPKISFHKSNNVKSQKIDFILPDDKVVNYFKNNSQFIKDQHKMKYKFFNAFFSIIDIIIFQNMNLIGRKIKKQRNFLDQGIFLFHHIRSKNNKNLQDNDKLFQVIKIANLSYKSQIDLKILFDCVQKQKGHSFILDQKQKEKLVLQKIVSIILHQTQRYVLYRHMSSISDLIVQKSYQNKCHSINSSQQIEKINLCRQNSLNTSINKKSQKIIEKDQIKNNILSQPHCPIDFYKKVLLIYKLILKQSQKYQIIERKLKNLCPQLIKLYQQKGSIMLFELSSNQILIKRQKKKKIKPSKSFAQNPKQFFSMQPPIDIKKLQQKAQKYFQKLISFIQVEILLQRKSSFHQIFGEYLTKRKSVNQHNKDNQKTQKSIFLSNLLNLLPKNKKSNQQMPGNYIKLQHSKTIILQKNLSFSSDSEDYQLNQTNLKDQDSLKFRKFNDQQLVMQILSKFIQYQAQQQYLTYFNSFQQALNVIKNQIDILYEIMELEKEIQKRKLKDKFSFLRCINKQQLIMQILRLYMRKIEIHFKNKRQQKSLTQITENKQISRSIYLNEFQYPFQSYYNRLKQNYNDPKNSYYQDQRVCMFLKNTQICKKYILLVCGNDKVTQQFTTSIGQIDVDYQQIFLYLCKQTWKKILFNQTNNIIFFKSRVMLYEDDPYAFVRKRNITMKYMKKLLNQVKINITFLHLTKNNFDYIQIDKKQNPNCEIKYLVLTVDCIQKIQKIQNKIKQQFYLLFQQNNNIKEDLVKFQTFLDMMSKVYVEFIIIMGKKAKMLAQKLQNKLRNNPIILAFQNSDYGLNNFVEYKDPKVINEGDQNSSKISEGSILQTQIYTYLDIECYHCLLDMIVCTLVSNLVHVSINSKKPYRSSTDVYQNSILGMHKQIKQIILKSINLAKQIMRQKWESSKQIQIQYQIFPIIPVEQQLENHSILKRNSSIISQLELNTKYSHREKSQIFKNFPIFQKGKIIDTTQKLFQSPCNLQDQDQPYYQNIGRINQLYLIMKFIQSQGHNIVQIHGSQNSGKSSFLLQICWINQVYRLFKDGVYYFDMKRLSKSLQTLMQHIQFFYKQHKLFTKFQEKSVGQLEDASTILIALDNLDSDSVKDNHDFFEKINGKGITLIYSTTQNRLEESLKNQLKIQIQNYDSYKRKHLRSKNSNSFYELSSRRSRDSYNYQSLQLRQMSSRAQSRQSEVALDQSIIKWKLLKVNVNDMGINELFQLALSYLKKQELHNLKIGLKEFIRIYFVKFIEDAFKQFNIHEPRQMRRQISTAVVRRTDSFISIESSNNQQANESTISQSPQRLRYSISQNNPNLVQRRNSQQSTLHKLLKKLNQFFQSLAQQRVQLFNSTIDANRIQQSLLMVNKNKNGAKNMKDTRLWFYEDCFEKLMIKNNTYDELEITLQ